jgi:hypothetical protein
MRSSTGDKLGWAGVSGWLGGDGMFPPPHPFAPLLTPALLFGSPRRTLIMRQLRIDEPSVTFNNARFVAFGQMEKWIDGKLARAPGEKQP